MLVPFFYHLRAHRLPVSVKEFLTLLEAMQRGIVPLDFEEFHQLARLILIKDETLFDRFDQAFASYYRGIQANPEYQATIPDDWLVQTFAKWLSEEEKAALEKLGWDALMQALEERLKEQTGRHAGGNKWIATGGTSPFGHGGYHPEGIRIGGRSQNRRAVKVWEERIYKDYDDQVVLGTRTIQVALRRLRKFARTGAKELLDVDDTIRKTAQNAGYLDLQMVAERRNNVKIVMLLDVGGSMDDHVQQIEELFSAARSEFKYLEAYYFHNCVYDQVWKNNQRRRAESMSTWDLLRKYPADWRLIFVGDATMSPYEILQPGGSVEYYNSETGAVWLARLVQHFPHHAWLNPTLEAQWRYHQSIQVIKEMVPGRMFPITLQGLTEAMQLLAK